jgi:hypothetical protein
MIEAAEIRGHRGPPVPLQAEMNEDGRTLLCDLDGCRIAPLFLTSKNHLGGDRARNSVVGDNSMPVRLEDLGCELESFL